MVALIDVTFLLVALQSWHLYYLHGAGSALVLVPVRIGVGWTLNLANPASWLVIATVAATIGGLAVMKVVAGL